MSRGRPPVPHQLKIVAGTDRPDRLQEPGIELPLIQGPIRAPYWMTDGFAIEEWDRLVPILTANRLLTEAGVSSLAVLCSAYGDLVGMWARGAQPATSQIIAYRGLMSEFGLSPLSQSKIKAPGEKDSGNKFASNGRRPA